MGGTAGQQEPGSLRGPGGGLSDPGTHNPGDMSEFLQAGARGHGVVGRRPGHIVARQLGFGSIELFDFTAIGIPVGLPSQ